MKKLLIILTLLLCSCSAKAIIPDGVEFEATEGISRPRNSTAYPNETNTFLVRFKYDVKK